MLWGPIKTALSAVVIGLQTLHTVFFPPSIFILGGKVQDFCGKTAKILALEQRITVLKALAFKDICVVQYTLFAGKLMEQPCGHVVDAVEDCG